VEKNLLTDQFQDMLRSGKTKRKKARDRWRWDRWDGKEVKQNAAETLIITVLLVFIYVSAASYHRKKDSFFLSNCNKSNEVRVD
jgi:hypothetical protein